MGLASQHVMKLFYQETKLLNASHKLLLTWIIRLLIFPVNGLILCFGEVLPVVVLLPSREELCCTGQARCSIPPTMLQDGRRLTMLICRQKQSLMQTDPGCMPITRPCGLLS